MSVQNGQARSFAASMESVKASLESAATKLKELGLPPEAAHGVGEEFVARLHDPVLDRSIESRADICKTQM